MRSAEILIATKNLHKLEEISQILAPYDVAVKSLLDFPDAGEAVEDGACFEENAAKKALFYAEETQLLSLADDSGLEIDYLNGDPGIHSARYLDPSMSFSDRCTYILNIMNNVGDGDRSAHFTCVIAIAFPGRLCGTFRGELRGFIAREKKGDYGFGYDPIFYVPEYRKNLAELEPSIKNAISHRARALQNALSSIIELARQHA
ncbi:MAG: RdgB/HAM1 family non-canonical purine NTP pyrophosphatase [Candidatus Xenobiia bacterium LiM19]